MQGCRLSMAVGVLLLLSACGFRLQGDLALPQAVAVIELQAVDRQSDFAHALARQLRDAGVEVRWRGRSEEPVAGALLQIEADEFLERVASISARNLPREYELTYRIRYSYQPSRSLPAESPAKIASEELTLSREFSFDERVALAKQREREQLRSTLANELAGMVVQRLASLR